MLLLILRGNDLPDRLIYDYMAYENYNYYSYSLRYFSIKDMVLV